MWKNCVEFGKFISDNIVNCGFQFEVNGSLHVYVDVAETASMHQGRRVSLYPLTEEEIFNNVILVEYLQSHECCDYRLRFIRPPDNIPNATSAKG